MVTARALMTRTADESHGVCSTVVIAGGTEHQQDERQRPQGAGDRDLVDVEAVRGGMGAQPVPAHGGERDHGGGVDRCG